MASSRLEQPHLTSVLAQESPTLVEIDGTRPIVEWNHRAVVGVESEAGRFLWEYELPHDGSGQNMPTPVAHEGRVILGAENRGIEQITPHRKSRMKPSRQDGRALRRSKHRWKVERTMSGLGNCRRLLVRHEYHAHLFEGFTHWACLLQCLRWL